MFTEVGIHAVVVVGWNIFIKDTVEYIDVVGASCLGNTGNKYLYTR
jgi:hypothetical protein